MKKTLLAVLAFALALSALGLSVFTWTLLKDYRQQLDHLEHTVAQLSSDLEAAIRSQDSLSDSPARYCTLSLAEWTSDAHTLTLTACHAQVMAEGTGLEQANLVVMINSEPYSTWSIDMLPGEAEGSFELDLSGLILTLPELKNGDQLELRLEATLTDGSEMSALGGTWDRESGRLLLVAG